MIQQITNHLHQQLCILNPLALRLTKNNNTYETGSLGSKNHCEFISYHNLTTSRAHGNTSSTYSTFRGNLSAAGI